MVRICHDTRNMLANLCKIEPQHPYHFVLSFHLISSIPFIQEAITSIVSNPYSTVPLICRLISFLYSIPPEPKKTHGGLFKWRIPKRKGASITKSTHFSRMIWGLHPHDFGKTWENSRISFPNDPTFPRSPWFPSVSQLLHSFLGRRQETQEE